MPETAPDDKVDCAIVIVTHNSARYIDSLLDSLPAATDGLSSRVVLVDNGSTDGTVGVVKRRPRINCVEAGGNLGYAGGINLGRSRAGDYAALAVLNPDLVLGAGALRHLFAALVEQQVGIAVPRLLNEDGTLIRRCAVSQPCYGPWAKDCSGIISEVGRASWARASTSPTPTRRGIRSTGPVGQRG